MTDPEVIPPVEPNPHPDEPPTRPLPGPERPERVLPWVPAEPGEAPLAR
ncbi:MAG: hypothetical protein ACKVWR_13760 [Acidimicrobiales bacterium]